MTPVNPLQIPLIAVLDLPGEVLRVKEVHIFGAVLVRYKGDNPPVPPAVQGESGLLQHLPAETVLGALPGFELAADADPFILVEVALLFHPVEHEVFLAPLEITEGGIDAVHGVPPLFRILY